MRRLSDPPQPAGKRDRPHAVKKDTNPAGAVGYDAWAMVASRVAPRVAAVAVAALAVVVWVRAVPLYFRADDALFLAWASAHANPLTAFVPAQATLIGVFRPVQNLAWWALFRVFGLNPAPYQFVVTALFLGCLALLHRIAGRMASAAAGWWAVASFLVVFPYLASVMFWFSDLSFLLETTLMLVAIGLLVEAFAGRLSFAWGTAAFVLSGLAKEPALGIVPAVAATWLAAQWRTTEPARRRRGLLAVGVLASIGLVALLVDPSLAGRQGGFLGTGLAAAAASAAERWRFYSVWVVSGAGVAAVGVGLFSAWRALAGRAGRASGLWLPLGISMATAWLVRSLPSVAVGLLVASVAVHVVLRRREGAAGVWFALPLLGLLSISFTVRTYLFEAAFGLAIFVGIVLEGVAREAAERVRRLRPRVAAAAAAALLVALAAAGPRLVDAVDRKANAVALVVAARQNFRTVVTALLDRKLPSATVVVVDYPDMGLDYTRDIVPLPDGEKAHRQKTMAAPELAAFLRVGGRPQYEVVTLSQFLLRPVGAEALLVVMSRAENAFLAGLPLERSVLVEARRSGEIALLENAIRTGP